jgi:hypothetical protein
MNDISNEKALQTTGILALACLIIGIVFQEFNLTYLAVLLLFIGLFLRNLSGRIAWIWLKIAESVGTLNTRVILVLIFFGILTPVAFLYRLFYGDFMLLRRNGPKTGSYWKLREHTFKPDDLEKLW